MSNLDLVLRNHGLRKTGFRMELLGLFTDTQSSLTAEEIRSKVKTTNDKVTIYRALDAFEKNGLIHRVPDMGNLTRYALCRTECNADKHVHDHAHFICMSCSETFCIDEIEVPVVKDSNGFKIKKSKLTLEGDCPDCIYNNDQQDAYKLANN